MKLLLLIAALVLGKYKSPSAPVPPQPPALKPTLPPPPSTLQPQLTKEALLKKAAQLDKLANDEINKFKAIDRTSLVLDIQILQQYMHDLIDRLNQATGALPLQVIQSQLFWLEWELQLVIDATEANNDMIVKLLTTAEQLKVRIDRGIERMGADTPVGRALAYERVSLDNNVNSLKKAIDSRTIQIVEFDLALIEERLKAELGPSD